MSLVTLDSNKYIIKGLRVTHINSDKDRTLYMPLLR